MALTRNSFLKIIALLLVGLMIAGGLVMLFLSSRTVSPSVVKKEIPSDKPKIEDQSVQPEPYSGKVVSIDDGFSVNVPNGWRASVSTNSSFLAMQFARPGQLTSLVYNQAAAPLVDYDGIPAWGGLTEHFYMRRITAPSQAFDPASHREVATEPFSFSDGTIGKKYSVSKHAAEAAQWGGLLKDDVWYGRVYVYEKEGKTIEAHLAYYPSTTIDTLLFENVAKSISLPLT